MQPPDEVAIGLALHTRMLAGDRTVTNDIFLRYHALLVGHLTHFVRRKGLFSADEDAVHDSVLSALVSYFNRPSQYDPGRGRTLAGYLKMSAEGDLKNLVTKRRPPDGLHVVPVDRDDWNNDPEDPRDEIAAIVDHMTDDAMHALVADVAETDEERIVLELMLAGERSNDVFAEALGWHDIPEAEAKKRITQIKDRLSKRLKRRYAGRMRDATAD